MYSRDEIERVRYSRIRVIDVMVLMLNGIIIPTLHDHVFWRYCFQIIDDWYLLWWWVHGVVIIIIVIVHDSLTLFSIFISNFFLLFDILPGLSWTRTKPRVYLIRTLVCPIYICGWESGPFLGPVVFLCQSVFGLPRIIGIMSLLELPMKRQWAERDMFRRQRNIYSKRAPRPLQLCLKTALLMMPSLSVPEMSFDSVLLLQLWLSLPGLLPECRWWPYFRSQIVPNPKTCSFVLLSLFRSIYLYINNTIQ